MYSLQGSFHKASPHLEDKVERMNKDFVWISQKIACIAISVLFSQEAHQKPAHDIMTKGWGKPWKLYFRFSFTELLDFLRKFFLVIWNMNGYAWAWVSHLSKCPHLQNPEAYQVKKISRHWNSFQAWKSIQLISQSEHNIPNEKSDKLTNQVSLLQKRW